MREKPIKVMHNVKQHRIVHIYKSGVAFVKDHYNTLGTYQFKSASDAIAYYRERGYR